jgi:diguanylate cyclase (GGDEF)-like protein
MDNKCNLDQFDFDATLLTVSFATRLLAMELDYHSVIDRALEAFCDIGSCRDAAIINKDRDERLTLVGASIDYERMFLDEEVPFEGALVTAASTQKPVIINGCPMSEFPIPSGKNSPCENSTCLCVPLVGSRDMVKGFITLKREVERPWSNCELFQIGILSTVAAIAIENTKLFRLAISDPLTDLYTRRYLSIRMDDEVTRIRRRGGELSLIMLDVDHFKNINDRYGHSSGDMALKQIAEIILENSRRGVDVVCRYGGEEFAVLMPSSDIKAAETVAERICTQCCKTLIELPNDMINISVSAGAASLAECDMPIAADLIDLSDRRLYEAKKRGRNCAVCSG